MADSRTVEIQRELVKRAPFHTVEKLWGWEYWFINNELYCEKKLVVKPRAASSYHFHPIKDEAWIIEEGKLTVFLGTASFIMEEGETIRIKTGVKHRFMNYEHYPAVIREVSTHHDDADVVRVLPSKLISIGETIEQSNHHT